MGVPWDDFGRMRGKYPFLRRLSRQGLHDFTGRPPGRHQVLRWPAIQSLAMSSSRR